MASSKVMATASPSNPDLPRHSPPSSCTQHYFQNSAFSSTSSSIHRYHHQPLLLHSSNDQIRNFGCMKMEEILKNMYSDSDIFPSSAVENNGGSGSAVDGGSDAVGGGGGCGVGGKSKTVDEVWREIVSGGGGGGGEHREPEMTLEDFLSKAGAVAVAEDDVRVPAAAGTAAGFGVETMMNSVQFQLGMHMQNGPPLGFGNGMVAVGGGSGGGRVKRRVVEEAPLDKATQQKQRRMIKNRESAARSRERKQAYTVELESLVTQLEEENARLLREEAELNKRRYKQLMENLIPVTEKQRPPRILRRVHSISW